MISSSVPLTSAPLTSATADNVGRECWLPRGLPRGVSVCIASSRLGRKLDQHDRWFDAIRTLAVQLNPENHFLITSAGTTTDPVVRRIGQLFEIPLLEVIYLPSAPTERWKNKIAAEISETSGLHFLCYVWPAEIQAVEDASPTENPSKRIRSKTQRQAIAQRRTQSRPPADQDLIEMADEAYLLSVRRNGNIHQAANSRLKRDAEQSLLASSTPIRKTWLLIEETLTPQKVERGLLEATAHGWWLYHDEPILDLLPTGSDETVSNEDGWLGSSETQPPTTACCAPLLELCEIDCGRFLVHWTRRRTGPWPDQSPEEHLDDLIFRTGRRQHDELATLRRIVATGRIEGSQRITRVANPVVCFADVPLDELTAKRTFRSHLGRWDFQPYGIAIDRDALRRCGGQPVIYGAESIWDSLEDHQRPWFQMAKTEDGKIDWREEREWRLLGNVDLTQFEIGEVIVFTKKATDAESIAEFSRWPVVVLDS